MEDSAGTFELAPGVWIDPDQLGFTFARSGGPGGQAVNKLSTQAQLRVSVASIHGLPPPARDRLRRLAGARLVQGDQLLITSSEHRSQLANRRACLRRLRKLVAAALVAPRPRKPTRPSRAAVEKRLATKRRLSQKKEGRRPPDADD